VVSTDGLIGKEAKTMMKKLSVFSLAEKAGKPYSAGIQRCAASMSMLKKLSASLAEKRGKPYSVVCG
jgi:hypothetical protein